MMDGKKTVVNRTTLTLYKTMLQLLERQGFDDITVNDICQHGMVSRSTFYSYFADKYSLVLFTLQQERAELDIVKGENVEQNLLKLLYRLKEKKRIYQNLLVAQTNQELTRMIVAHTSEFVAHTLAKTAVSDERLKVQTTFYTSGIAGTVLWWIENNFPVNEEALAKDILTFTSAL